MTLSGVLRSFVAIGRLLAGALTYLITGKTPSCGYQSMIFLFCRTGGLSNDLLAWTIRWFRRPYRLPEVSGLLGQLSRTDLDEISCELKERGYHVFKSRLPEDICDRLLHFGQTASCEVLPLKQSRPAYSRKDAEGVRYDVSPQDLIDHPDVQDLLADVSILRVAQSYLGSIPITEGVSMWWLTAFSGQPDKEAAQYFHFDMDRIKWLKFFIYLTDVTPETGPHSFVSGSHRSGGIPWLLRKKGYARLNDEDVRAHYPHGHVVELTGPRGTIIAEDTRGLHKGKHLLRGDRLVLQLQFSNSLFGAARWPIRFRDIKSSLLAARVRDYPKIYANYLVTE